MTEPWMRQEGNGIRFDWGLAGARALGPDCACLVVVDVLSFTTSVSVAVERGVRVVPRAWRADAPEVSAEAGAVVARGRRAVTADHPWSLSPAALRRAPAIERLILPSPNGSAISAAVEGIPVVAASLRNATAVAEWIAGNGWGSADRPVAVIAAGEHWPDGRLRPAIEDQLGAAAVIRALAAHGGPLSAEATLAIAGIDSITDLPALVRSCASGRELTAAGFADDVRIAVEIDACGAVPVLVDGEFSDARRGA
ncbi:2-phosphosulfolactate phosphatase [Nocardia nova]|uniref:2-phosphosulfolactate phosphatase n=1 Tax=Nocardia nova TaxID=37330 RepID=UPI0034071D2C